jgi:hypothetical protein
MRLGIKDQCTIFTPLRNKNAKMKNRLFGLVLLALFTAVDVSACTIFFFVHNGNMYFCNNEDWSDPDTEIRFHPAKRGSYAWVYFGFSNNWAQGGVNEKGLCWDWVAGYKVDDWTHDPSKKTFKGNLSEEMIKRCADVEEAIKFLRQYNDESLSYARMMIADKKGNSAIIGWKDGKMDIQRNSGALQAFGYKGSTVQECFASGPAERGLGFISEVLNKAHQEGRYPTQYSNIISITEGKIYLFQSRNYEKYVEIDYLQKLEEKYARYKIGDLFTHAAEYPDIKLVEL